MKLFGNTVAIGNSIQIAINCGMRGGKLVHHCLKSIPEQLFETTEFKMAAVLPERSNTFSY